MRVYIAGPMTGIEDLNFPAFHAAADALRAAGFDPVNPADINPGHGTPYQTCMRNDLTALLTCDAVALLEGWEHSRGARLEHHVSTHLGLIVAPLQSILRHVAN